MYFVFADESVSFDVLKRSRWDIGFHEDERMV